MKATSTKFALIQGTSLAQLTTEVKETLAPVSMLGQFKTFSSAELWNIQRQVKYRAQRRFL